jgi:hypothetical protein
MDEFREIELLETQLRVYRDGTIWRLTKGGGKGYKKGEWVLVNVCMENNGYLRCQISGKHTLSHRIIALVYLGLDINDKKIQIDHKNRIRNDNRVENLRIVSPQQNQFNTGAKGYYFDKKYNKYVSQIRVNRKSIFLGSFDTEEEASNAYQSAKLVHHVL